MNLPGPKCHKHRYRNIAAARQAARKLFWRTDARAASVYFCLACAAWHVTSRPAKRGAWRRW